MIILLVMVSCHRQKNVSEQKSEPNLEQWLKSAEWKTYVDKTYQVEVEYPDFFETDTVEAGTARFICFDGENKIVQISMFVEPNVEGRTIEEAAKELCDSFSTCLEVGKDYYIMEGCLKDAPNYLFLEKCYLIGDNWYNLTVYYHVKYKDAIGRIQESVKGWNPKSRKGTNSFTIEYRQPVNGYKVKAVVNMEDDILAANLTFMKDGQSFSLHTTSYGDTLYNKGQWGLLGENEELIKNIGTGNCFI